MTATPSDRCRVCEGVCVSCGAPLEPRGRVPGGVATSDRMLVCSACGMVFSEARSSPDDPHYHDTGGPFMP